MEIEEMELVLYRGDTGDYCLGIGYSRNYLSGDN